MKYDLIFFKEPSDIEVGDISDFYFNLVNNKLYKVVENNLVEYNITYEEFIKKFWYCIPKPYQDAIEEQVINLGRLENIVSSRTVSILNSYAIPNKYSS